MDPDWNESTLSENTSVGNSFVDTLYRKSSEEQHRRSNGIVLLFTIQDAAGAKGQFSKQPKFVGFRGIHPERQHLQTQVFEIPGGHGRHRDSSPERKKQVREIIDHYNEVGVHEESEIWADGHVYSKQETKVNLTTWSFTHEYAISGLPKLVQFSSKIRTSTSSLRLCSSKGARPFRPMLKRLPQMLSSTKSEVLKPTRQSPL